MKKSHIGYSSPGAKALFLLCWAAYWSSYICRLNFSAVMPDLLRDGAMTQAQAAAVTSAFFICYGAGQVLSGILGDKLSGRFMIFTGTAVSALCNILISFFSTSYYAVLILWGLNGAVQSMIWSPMLGIAGTYFNPTEREKFGVDISTTVPLGTLASYGVSLLTLLVLPWRWVFLVCGGIVAVCSAVWLIGTGKVLPNMKASAAESDGGGDVRIMPMKQLFAVCTLMGIPVLLVSIAAQGALKDSVTSWLPTFLDDGFNAGTGISLLLTMILPIINVTGAFFARAVNKRVKDEILTSVIFFIIAAVFLAVLIFFGGSSIILSLICMAGVTNCMFAVNVMLLTMLPLRFSVCGRASTVGGFLNAAAYIGCGLLNIVAGNVLENSDSSWTALFIMWIILTLAAAVASAVVYGIRHIYNKIHRDMNV